MKTLIFDAGDVITYFTLDDFGTFIRSRDCSVEQDKAFFKEKKSLYDAGEMTTEQFWREYIQVTGVRATPEELISAIRSTIHVDKDMLSLLSQLKKNHRLLLASNIDPVTYEETERLLGSDLFEAQYISFKMGKLKSDPTFFSDIIRQQALSPEDAVFIDDSRRNVASAESVGIKGIVFKNRAQLIEELKLLGIVE